VRIGAGVVALVLGQVPALAYDENYGAPHEHAPFAAREQSAGGSDPGRPYLLLSLKGDPAVPVYRRAGVNVDVKRLVNGSWVTFSALSAGWGPNDTSAEEIEVGATLGGMWPFWPEAVGSDGARWPDGDYRLYWSVNGYNQTLYNPVPFNGDYVLCRVVGGVFSTDQQTPAPNPGALDLRVVVAGSAANANGFTTTITGPVDTPISAVQNGTLGTTGAAMYACPIYGAANGSLHGNYTVQVSGTYNGVSFNAQHNSVMRSDQTRRLTVTFDAQGAPTWTEDPLVGDDPGGGTGGLLDGLGALVRSLFVPQQSTITGMQNSWQQFLAWGPYQFVSELAAALTAEAVPFTGFPIPNFAYANGVWGTTTSTVTIDFSSVTGQSGWAAIRTLLGAGVWLVFAWGVLQVLFPKQVVD
jgi:hypothetical protein